MLLTHQNLYTYGVQVLAGYQDYNQYCYIVAGTVGNLATDLVILHYQLSGSVAEHLLRYSQACGRGLQKTNIVKDFPEDRFPRDMLSAG